MFPTLFGLSTYGLLLSLAVFLGVGLVLGQARGRGRRLEPYVDLIFAVLLAGLVGARLGYALEHPGELKSLADFFSLQRGGLSILTGMLLAIPTYAAVMHWRGLPLWETSDQLVPIFPLTLGLVRLGCFCAGCCYGTPTDLPWGVKLTSPLLPPELTNARLHPTQLYEAIFLFTLAAGLFAWHRHRPKPGVVVTAFFLAYGLFRGFTFPLRGDLVGNQSTTLFLIATLTLVSAGIFGWRMRRPICA